MSKVWIGTSGWTYDGWRGPFYPPDVAKTKWLCWYAGQFPTTEINGSFYRTPSLKAVEAWRDQTPKDFLFAWKASKFITHWKRLNENCPNSIELMETRLKALSPKVGAVLFQLPPQFSKNRERLASFLHMLPRCYPYAFEFRHKSWYDDDIYQLLRAHDVALCISDHHDAPSPWEVTARHVYLRGHGPDGRYKDHYPDRILRTWARHIGEWRRSVGQCSSISTTTRRAPLRPTRADWPRYCSRPGANSGSCMLCHERRGPAGRIHALSEPPAMSDVSATCRLNSISRQNYISRMDASSGTWRTRRALLESTSFAQESISETRSYTS